MALTLYSLILGAVQGLTEFLPISSSGHLVILHYLWPQLAAHSLSFDVWLHAGTLLALVIYFRQTIIDLMRGVVKPGPNDNKKLFWQVVVATMPVVIATAFGIGKIESSVREVWVVAMMLIIGAILLAVADRQDSVKQLSQLSWWAVILIGAAQIFALVPGLSRSGVLIAAGLLLGLNRESAARFAFLLAIPAILGAVLWHWRDLMSSVIPITTLLVGFLTAFVFGYLAVAGLIKWLKNNSLMPFVWYRLALAAVIIVILLI